MNSQQPERDYVTPVVVWVAHQIDDPLTRLRFLKAVQPSPVCHERSRRRQPRIAICTMLVLAASGAAYLVRAATRVRTVAAAAPVQKSPEIAIHPISKVWLVDKSAESENFSNGLRIDTRFESPNHPRSYLAFPAHEQPEMAGVRGEKPVGIVFHTTESRQAPFDASQNRALKQIGESLLEFVRRQHAYHYLIDRFGRVYRVVPELDSANHAGFSVWSDDTWIYLNLNESFLGISFEAETQPGQSEPAISPAQIQSAAILTEMLRDRYSIPATNCITHAQVSVNPDNMRVGYHTDWASSFPFSQMGLPDNYDRPSPAVTAFGFEYDATFQHWAGPRLYSGIERAEQELSRQAASAGVSLKSWRKGLQTRYRSQLAAVRGQSAEPSAAAESPR